VDELYLGVTKTRANTANPSAQMDGHKGIGVDRSTDVLVQNFRINATFYHDVSVSWWAAAATHMGRPARARAALHRTARARRGRSWP
jgi:hypothetical protein